MKPVIGIALFAVVLVGCGASDEDQIRDSMETVLLGLADGDGDEVCAEMTEAGQEELAELSSGGDSCEFGANVLGGESYDFDSAEIDRITIEGETATVGLVDDTSTFDFVKEDGEWKLEDL